LEDTWDKGDPHTAATFTRASGMMNITPQSEQEMEAIRDAVVNREGLLLSLLDVLRRVPRRVVMVLKLNDLTRYVENCIQTVPFARYSCHYRRNLDHALMTTHSNVILCFMALRSFLMVD
jgi:aarF domain-containing kinase